MTIELTPGVRYDKDDIDALRGHEGQSTSAAVNAIAAHTGTTQNHTIRGDDKTEREIHDESKGKATDGLKHFTITAGTRAVEHGAAHLVEGAALGVLGGVVMVATAAGGAVVEMVAMMHAVGEDAIAGQERAAAIPKDALHCYMLGNLAGLPREYADDELARYPESAKTSNFAKALDARLGKGDTFLMARAQLHCDQGMVAARATVDAKQAPSKDVVARCAADPAFKAGFEAVMWARGRGPDVYKDVIAGLEARDARYEQAHVAWRA
jgi:hypothetical protein